MRKTDSPHRDIDWAALIDTALTAPGRMSTDYNRFYTYSFLNQMLLLQQGVREPVATYKRWQSLGRQVPKGSHAKEIVRPVPIVLKDQLDDDGQPKRITKFKLVKCLFGYSETTGDEIPMPEMPEWSLDKALGTLDIKRVPFRQLNGNIAGYSAGREIAINPTDEHPLQTTFHELGHVVLGHTVPGAHDKYRAHRGLWEFQAEATAYLAGHEVEMITQDEASESRAYIRGWLGQDVRPSDTTIRQVFKATDDILRAGRPSED